MSKQTQPTPTSEQPTPTPEEIKLGMRVRSIVSGFQGTVMGLAVYANETPKALVCAPRLSMDGDIKEAWLSVAELEKIPTW